MTKTNVTFGQQAGFAVPASGSVSASVRALPTTGAVSPAAAGSMCGHVDATSVIRYRRTAADVVVLKGAFPGPYAWRPPID